MVGRAAERLIGNTMAEAFPELDLSAYIALLDRAYSTGEPFQQTELVAPKLNAAGQADDGFFNVVYQPMRGDDREVHGIAIVAVDVTTQVRARQEAEAANRAKGDFLAAMSHELRTPLNAIGGYVQLVELGVHGPITDAQRETFARVQRSQQHLLSLINDVLNFTKLEAGRVEYEFDDVRVVDVVADVVTMIEPQLSARGLASRVDVPAGLVARADREKLQQVLINLLSNAVKFTSAGTVSVEAGPAGGDDASGCVEIRVSDTGIGIPRERLEAIFDPFVQVHRRLTNSTEGTGLGLAISRDLARGMGGELRVRSDEGRGSVFILTLPGPAAP
jgi:signal transduction histidine kinase